MNWPLAGDLTDDVLEGELFARAGTRQGTRRRVEPDWAALAIELKKPGVTLFILWEEYRAAHPDGYGYSRFCDLFRGFEQRLSPTMRQEHMAGDNVFVDYSGKKVLSFSSICATFSFRVVPTDCIYGVDRKHLLAVWADPSEMKNWVKFVR